METDNEGRDQFCAWHRTDLDLHCHVMPHEHYCLERFSIARKLIGGTLGYVTLQIDGAKTEIC